MLKEGLIRIVGGLESAVTRGVRLKNRYPPLFIVGAPRSGTTVVARYLESRYRFAYLPNISKRHPRACVTLAAYARFFLSYEVGYGSEYGQAPGPGAPSDGWDVFHRWFPRYDHSRPVAEGRLYELRNIVRMLEIIYGAPFLNKNNNNSTRIAQLARVFPDAFFLFVRRDVRDTVKSLLAARERHHVGLNEWWSAAPPQYWNRRFSSEVEQAVYGTRGVEDCVARSLAQIPAERWRAVHYEEFCEQPIRLAERVSGMYSWAGITLAPGALLSEPVFERRTHSETPEVETEITRQLDIMAGEKSGKMPG